MDINEYLSLPSSENLLMPKFMSYLEMILKMIVSHSAMNDTIGTAFDVANAAGDQLDIIGELIGIKRLMDFVPTGGGSRKMTDEEYRMVIQLKIARNEWDGTNADAVRIYREFFSKEMVVAFEDNQDASLYITVYGNFSLRGIKILQNSDVFLIPAGVKSTVVVIGDDVTLTTYLGCMVAGVEIHDSVLMLD